MEGSAFLAIHYMTTQKSGYCPFFLKSGLDTARHQVLCDKGLAGEPEFLQWSWEMEGQIVFYAFLALALEPEGLSALFTVLS